MTVERLMAEIRLLDAALTAVQAVRDGVDLTERARRAGGEYLHELRWQFDTSVRALESRLEILTFEEEARGWPGDEPGFTLRNTARTLLDTMKPKVQEAT